MYELKTSKYSNIIKVFYSSAFLIFVIGSSENSLAFPSYQDLMKQNRERLTGNSNTRFNSKKESNSAKKSNSNKKKSKTAKKSNSSKKKSKTAKKSNSSKKKSKTAKKSNSSKKKSNKNKNSKSAKKSKKKNNKLSNSGNGHPPTKLVINPMRDLGKSKGYICFRIKAYSNTDTSEFSQPVCTYRKNSKNFGLAWDRGSNSVIGYQVFFGTSAKKTNKFLADII